MINAQFCVVLSITNVTNNLSNEVVKISMEHNHAAQAARPDALRVKQFLKERASATQETPQQIMSQAVEGIHANVAVILPSKETIKRNIRKRKNKDGAPAIPENVGNLVLPQVSNTNNSYKLM
ncbi:hypothetical protein RN001_005867 [Aquatica leii]|uniref:FLYWCH-type domain-containing protein n=1 Tax=Aquatica leii TaxID=1421715 RepID=A0AAN7PDA4_9COLE|nr:hypothetical protein RN001_005867 [Aquatica leii]